MMAISRIGRAPPRCSQPLLLSPVGGKYDKALLQLEEIGPTGEVAGGCRWRNTGDHKVSEGSKGTWKGGIRNQCPWEVPGASEALLSWGRLP